MYRRLISAWVKLSKMSTNFNFKHFVLTLDFLVYKQFSTLSSTVGSMSLNHSTNTVSTWLKAFIDVEMIYQFSLLWCSGVMVQTDQILTPLTCFSRLDTLSYLPGSWYFHWLLFPFYRNWLTFFQILYLPEHFLICKKKKNIYSLVLTAHWPQVVPHSNCIAI